MQAKNSLLDRLLIRRFRAADSDQLIQLFDLNTPLFFDASEQMDYLDYLQYKVEDYFVVEEDRSVVAAGGVNYFEGQQQARIAWDLVHPSKQGKGIGTYLLQHRIKYIERIDFYEHIVVRTSQHSFRFYERNGFVLMQTKKDFWAVGMDLYVMEHNPKII